MRRKVRLFTGFACTARTWRRGPRVIARIDHGPKGLTAIIHRCPAADANLLAVAARTPSSRFDVVSTTPSATFGPCGPLLRHLGALATNIGEILRQDLRFIVTNLDGQAKKLHERVYCQRWDPILCADSHTPGSASMLRLHDNHLSGNGYKPRLLLAHLGQSYERIEVDILKGESRTPEFLTKNANGRIPVLELEDGTCIAESNAILFYLAEGSAFLPSERLARALVLQWMFFEQYSHEPCIAVVRHWFQHVGMTESQRVQLPDKQEGGRSALTLMERHLGVADWFGGNAMSIADFSLYAYTHVANEGGFDLGDYPAVGAWLARVAAQPGHVPMNPAPEGVVHPTAG